MILIYGKESILDIYWPVLHVRIRLVDDGRCWQKPGYSQGIFEDVLLTENPDNCGIWKLIPGKKYLLITLCLKHCAVIPCVSAKCNHFVFRHINYFYPYFRID